MLENHRQQDEGFGRASHRFVDVASEGLAEGVAGKATNREPVFYPQVFERVVDVLFGVGFPGLGVADDRQMFVR